MLPTIAKQHLLFNLHFYVSKDFDMHKLHSFSSLTIECHLECGVQHLPHVISLSMSETGIQLMGLMQNISRTKKETDCESKLKNYPGLHISKRNISENTINK